MWWCTNNKHPTRRVLFWSAMRVSSFPLAARAVRNLGFGLSHRAFLFPQTAFSSRVVSVELTFLSSHRHRSIFIYNSKRSISGPHTFRERGKEDVVRSTSALASETVKRVLKKTGKHRLRGVSVAFTAMGEHELGDFHMHELLGNPQKFRRAHFEGTIDAAG